MAGRIFVSRVSGVVQMDDGALITLQEGVTRVREGHALLEGRGDLFQEIGVHHEHIEVAVSRPVVPEKRGPGRPPKSGA